MEGTAPKQRGTTRVKTAEQTTNTADTIAGVTTDATRVTRGASIRLNREAVLLLRLTLLMTGLWILAVGMGALQYTGRPALKTILPLIRFDRLLRWAGPLLPGAVLVLRYLAQVPLQEPATGAPLPAAPPPLVAVGALYLGVTAARLGLYLAHLLAAPLIVAFRGVEGRAHVMSDHILLGASLTAVLTAEAHLLAADVRRWRPGSPGSRQLRHRTLIVAAAVVCGLLFALVSTEMHITARHFHAPQESFWAVIVGLVAFQLPVTLFMLRATS